MALFSPLYPLPPREPDRAWSRNYTFLANLPGEFADSPEPSLVMRVARHPDVRDRPNNEEQRLHDANDRAQCIKGQRDDQLGETREQPKDLVIGEHIGKKTYAERKRTEQVVGDLDHNEEPRQPPERA